MGQKTTKIEHVRVASRIIEKTLYMPQVVLVHSASSSVLNSFEHIMHFENKWKKWYSSFMRQWGKNRPACGNKRRISKYFVFDHLAQQSISKQLKH